MSDRFVLPFLPVMIDVGNRRELAASANMLTAEWKAAEIRAQEARREADALRLIAQGFTDLAKYA